MLWKKNNINVKMELKENALFILDLKLGNKMFTELPQFACELLHREMKSDPTTKMIRAL